MYKICYRIATSVLCGVAMAAKAVDFQEKQKEALIKVLFMCHLQIKVLFMCHLQV